MGIYLFYFFVFFLLALKPNVLLNTWNEKIVLSFLMIFVCFGYMTGSDWRNYELLYNDIDNALIYNNHHEIFYLYLNKFFSLIGFGFWEFHILIKCICFIITFSFISKHTQKHYALGLLFFFAVFSLVYYIDCPKRNLIASVIFLLSIESIYKRKFIKYVIIVIIASLFHKSALILLPVYLLQCVNIKSRTFLIIIISFIVIALFANHYFRNILEIVLNNSYISNFTADKMSYFLDETNLYYTGKSITLVSIVALALRILLFFQIVKNRAVIEKKYFGQLMINLSFLYIIIFCISFAIPMIGRFQMYLAAPFTVCISMLNLTSIIERVKSLVLVVVISISTLIGTITVSGTFKYIPYTNYLAYIFSDKPNYYQRSIYNYEHSPYVQPEDR